MDVPVDAPIELPMDAPMDAPMQPPMDAPMDAPMDPPMDPPMDLPMDAPMEPPMDALMEAPMVAPMDLSDAAEAQSVPQGSDETVPPCVSGPQYVRVSAGLRVQLIQLIQLVVRSGPSRISWPRQRRLRSAQQRRYVQKRLNYKE
jgi:hypothetical protein